MSDMDEQNEPFLQSNTIDCHVIDTEETIGQETGEVSVEAFENYLQSDDTINRSTLERKYAKICSDNINCYLCCSGVGVAGIVTLDDEPIVSLSSTNELATPSPDSIFPPLHSPSVSQHPVNVALSYHDETTTRVQIISELLRKHITMPDTSNLIFDLPTVHANMSIIDRRKTSKHIYKRAALVIVFLSPTYHDCNLCYNDWRAITDRFMAGWQDQQSQRLLLVKLGDFNADNLGLFADDWYLDAVNKSDEDVVNIIVDRWSMVQNLLV
ncbi:unnamed protein product [Rotaria sp. Silwood1]|nr:unnamed protein product [Rotaria sp. Silwood1]CAF3612863.1 unnamed protein product [Rotaria sp. Silwood1]CAF4654777.1 unnamed protein product [Rotaria sp. Silwood1]